MAKIGDIKREGKWSTKYIWVECPICLRKRWMRLSNYKRGGMSGLCLVCFYNKHRNKVGELTHDGYVLVKQKGHHRARFGVYVKRAVLIAEQKRGRPLLATEHTHHINGHRDDDRPDNITVLTNSEHARLHMTIKPNIKNRYQMALTLR